MIDNISVNMKTILILLISFLLIGEIVKGQESENIQDYTTYKTLVDGYKGFYRVFDIDNSTFMPFENKTLYIKKGDTMIWSNYDIDYHFTVLSKEKLWSDNKGKLRSTGKIISYTFNKSGVYTFDLKDYDKFPPMIIIVNDTNDGNTTNGGNAAIYTSSIVNNNKIVIDNSSVSDKIKNNNKTTVKNSDTVIDNSSVSDKIKNNTIRNIDTNESQVNVTTIDKDLQLKTNLDEPLNIMKNVKKILMITLGIVVLTFLFKGRGEEL